MINWYVDAAPGNSGHGPARSRDRNERGETAMHVAAIKGDQEGIKKLLEQGMSPNVPDFAGKCQDNISIQFHNNLKLIHMVYIFQVGHHYMKPVTMATITSHLL